MFTQNMIVECKHPRQTLMKELIFGLDCVQMALSANRRQIYKLLVYQNVLKPSEKVDEILDDAKRKKVPIQYTTRKELDIFLSDRPHQVHLSD